MGEENDQARKNQGVVVFQLNQMRRLHLKGHILSREELVGIVLALWMFMSYFVEYRSGNGMQCS